MSEREYITFAKFGSGEIYEGSAPKHIHCVHVKGGRGIFFDPGSPDGPGQVVICVGCFLEAAHALFFKLKDRGIMSDEMRRRNKWMLDFIFSEGAFAKPLKPAENSSQNRHAENEPK